MKNRLICIVIAAMMFAFTACGGTTGTVATGQSDAGSSGTQESLAGKTNVFEDGAGPVIVCNGGDYSNSVNIVPGYWVKTDEIHLRTGEQSAIALRYDGIADQYAAGGKCDPDLTIEKAAGTGDSSYTVSGSIYFADLAEGDDAFGQSAAVREYFLREPSASHPRFVMREFGTGKGEGREGNAEAADGTEKFYYSPVCYFPRIVSENDTIWLVVDITVEGKEQDLMRDAWEFTWIPGTEEASETEPELSEEESAKREDSPEWRSTTYSGRWDLTNILYAGEDGESVYEEGETQVRVKAERQGVDGQEILYTFETADGHLTVLIPEERFTGRYYPGDSFHQELEIFCTSDSDRIPGCVICSLAFADVTMESGENGDAVTVQPRAWFQYGWPRKDLTAFGPIPHDDTMSWRNDLQRGYIMSETSFPEGQADGEKLCIVYGSAASGVSNSHLYNIYEYTWTEGEETVWTHYEPMY